jgi:hypothetical protein
MAREKIIANLIEVCPDGIIGVDTQGSVVKFKKIFIEITNCCNLSCRFCQPSQRIKAFMTPDEFAQILRKISGFTEHISLHVLGEPLLHPDLGLLLDISRNCGFHVNLTTNGTLLAQRGETLLKTPPRQVNVSLHSAEQFGSASDIDLYVDGVLDFIRAAGSPPPLFINLRLWNLRSDTPLLNERILERLVSFFELPDIITENCAPGRNVTLAPGIFLSLDQPFIWPHAPAPDLGDRGYCRGLKDHIAVLVDGTVVPCCLDAEADIPLGDLYADSLTEILAAPRTVAMEKGFSRQQIVEPLCRRCGYKERFSHL